MYRHILLLVLLLLTISLTACSTAPEPRAEGINLSPTMTPLQALDAAGPHLPSDSLGVLFASGSEGWDDLEVILFPLADGLLEPGSTGTARGLRDDLNDLFEARLGFGLMDLHTVVVGGSLAEVQVIAFGDVEFAGTLSTVDTPAGAAYELPLRFLFEGLDSKPNPYSDPSIYILPLETPHRGMIFSMNPNSFGDSSLSERTEERLRPMIAEVDSLSPSTVFTLLVDALPEPDLGVPLPDSLLLSIGSYLTATMAGPDETLDAIDEVLAAFFAEARGELQPALADLNNIALTEAMLALYAHHLLEGFSTQLAPRRGDGLLTYEVELSDHGWVSLIVLAHVLRDLRIVDLFSTEESRVQTAQMELRQLEKLVELFYLSSSPNRLPDSLEELTDGPMPVVQQIPLDPWGTPYIYIRKSDTEFTLYSAGPDGIEGTEDDIHLD